MALFDVSYGNIFYEILPEDLYVLGTLERLSKKEYMYRVLKADGFDRVVFLDVDTSKIDIWAFDKFSALSFQYTKEFKEVKNWRDDAALQRFYSEVEGKKVTKINNPKDLFATSSKQSTEEKEKEENLDDVVVKKEIGWKKYAISSILKDNKTVLAEFTTHIKSALEDKSVKTVIVFEGIMFREAAGNILDAVLRFKKESTKNAVIFSFSDIDSLKTFSGNRFFKELIGYGNTDAEMSCEDKMIQKLEENYALIRANAWIGIDEIANYLLYQKLILNRKEMVNISFSKIYPLAQLIGKSIAPNARVSFFKSIDILSKATYIRRLEILFDDKRFIDELVEKSKSIKDCEVEYVPSADVYVNRVSKEEKIYINDNEDVEAIYEKLDSFIGEEFKNIKEQIIETIDYWDELREETRAKIESGEDVSDDDFPWLNMRFVGSPGTGKTSIAEIVARLLCAKGILRKKEPVIVNCADYMKTYANQGAEDLRWDIENAVGGVIVLDEFKALDQPHSTGNSGSGMMTMIVSEINKHKDDLCIIIVGYREELNKVLKMDKGGSRRFPSEIVFEDYSVETLYDILVNTLKKKKYVLADNIVDKVKKVINAEKSNKGEDFGNAGDIKSLCNDLDKQYRTRIRRGDEKNGVIILDDLINARPGFRNILDENNEESVESILHELDELYGEEMAFIKKQLNKHIRLLEKKRQKYDDKVKAYQKVKDDDFPFMNMCFLGSPGTGKTTIANIVARLLCAKGILTKNTAEVVNCADYMRVYANEGAAKLRADLENAVGGVIVLDEFKALDQPHSNGNSGSGMMTTIVSEINKHKNNLCIIVAGYKKDVTKILKFDNGATRRFPFQVNFDDYSSDTLMLILENKMEEEDMSFEDGLVEKIRAFIDREKVRLKLDFGNAGYLDNLFDKLYEEYLDRDGEDGVFTLEDLKNAFPDENFEEGIGNISAPKYEKIDAELIKNQKSLLEEKKYEESELALAVEKAIMLIETDKGKGTGFLISIDGYILTCNHVIDGANKIKARLRIRGREGGDDSFYDCKVINAKKDCDIALLKLEGGSNFPFLSLANEERKIEVREEFIISGYPFGNDKDLTVFAGAIASGDFQEEGGCKCYYINGEAKRGNSGSPLISLKDGRVIGLLAGSVTKGGDGLTEEINYMRPIELFWKHFVK